MGTASGMRPLAAWAELRTDCLTLLLLRLEPANNPFRSVVECLCSLNSHDSFIHSMQVAPSAASAAQQAHLAQRTLGRA